MKTIRFSQVHDPNNFDPVGTVRAGELRARCPQCEGDKIVNVQPYGAPSPYDYDAPCEKCSGTGAVAVDRATLDDLQADLEMAIDRDDELGERLARERLQLFKDNLIDEDETP